MSISRKIMSFRFQGTRITFADETIIGLIPNGICQIKEFSNH